MDYKALVAMCRDILDDEDGVRRGSDIRTLLTLCDAVEALEKDRELLDRMEALMLSIGEARIDLNFYPEERGSVMEGEPDYHFPGGFQVGDDGSKPYHPSLRACIAAHLAPTASTPTPAAPSDA